MGSVIQLSQRRRWRPRRRLGAASGPYAHSVAAGPANADSNHEAPFCSDTRLQLYRAVPALLALPPRQAQCRHCRHSRHARSRAICCGTRPRRRGHRGLVRNRNVATPVGSTKPARRDDSCPPSACTTRRRPVEGVPRRWPRLVLDGANTNGKDGASPRLVDAEPGKPADDPMRSGAGGCRIIRHHRRRVQRYRTLRLADGGRVRKPALATRAERQEHRRIADQRVCGLATARGTSNRCRSSTS